MPRSEYKRLSVEEKIRIANEHLVDKIPTSVLSEKYKCHVNNIKKYINNVKNNKTMYKHGKNNKLQNKYFTSKDKLGIANEHIQDGISAEDLAKKYGCTSITIKKYIDRVLNNKPIDSRTNIDCKSRVCVRLSLEDKIKIASEHIYNGIKQIDLAKKYKCNIGTIGHYVSNFQKNKLDYESGKIETQCKSYNKFSNEDKVKIANEHLIDGISYKDLALKYHCSDVTIRNHVKAVKSGKYDTIITADTVYTIDSN